MKNNKKFVLDYNTSKKFDEIQNRIKHFVAEDMNAYTNRQLREANKRLNELAYDLAQSTGQSVWDVCLRYFPQKRPACVLNEKTGREEVVLQVKLIPIEYDLERNEEYWKAKYYKLKEEMQELLSRSDELLPD